MSSSDDMERLKKLTLENLIAALGMLLTIGLSEGTEVKARTITAGLAVGKMKLRVTTDIDNAGALEIRAAPVIVKTGEELEPFVTIRDNTPRRFMANFVKPGSDN